MRSTLNPLVDVGVGGVKGANVYTFDLILEVATDAFNQASASEQAAFTKKYGADVKGANQALLRAAVKDPVEHYANVNIRNNIRKGDKTNTPLQFVYEAADCRLFYTALMIHKQELVWKAAYESFFGNSACVKGSTNQPSSDPGTDYILCGQDSTDCEKPSSSQNGGATSTNLGASPSKTNAADGLCSGEWTLGLVVLTAMMTLL